MRVEETEIAGVPALVIGEKTEGSYLFIHGKMGCKEEALAFAEVANPRGYQVIGIDLPGHGSRRAAGAELLPWIAVPEILRVFREIQARASNISLRANSIGAWLAMMALQKENIRRALLVSPVVDMESLIRGQMSDAGVTEGELRERKNIPLPAGDPLSWEYLTWVRAHPFLWGAPTSILIAAQDAVTPRAVTEAFSARIGCALTVMENGEHWFHTEEQLRVLREWEAASL